MSKLLWALTAATIAAALACALYFVVATIGVRAPYWGEAEVIFDAQRLRAGLPLFVDPLAGAHEYGEPPSRWFVTYPPMWAGVLALVPSGAMLVVPRVLCTVAWLGSLAWLAATARRESRVEAIACAAFVAGQFVILNFATTGRPDSIACALAAFGLARAMRRGRIDVVSGALLVLAPWVKPTLLGLPLGAFAGDAWARRDKRPILAALGATAALAAVAHVASGGAIFRHVVVSNGQAFSLRSWMDQLPSRLPFFAPLFAVAAWNAWRDKRANAIGLGALAASVAWVVFALAKIGSSSNYWMEPCVAALALVARAEPRFGRAGKWWHAAAALAAVLWADVAAIDGSLRHVRDLREDAAFVARLRSICGEGVIYADEPGVELLTDGRILTPAFQTARAIGAGKLPSAPFVHDLRDPHVACVVEHSGDYAPASELGRAIHERFGNVAVADRGWRVLTSAD